MFLKVSVQNIKYIIKFDRTVSSLKNNILSKSSIEATSFFNSHAVVIEEEDLPEYISQYISDKTFVLFINGFAKLFRKKGASFTGDYNKNQSFSSVERVKLSKSIVKQILHIDPNRRLNPDQLEKISSFLVQIFDNEISETYYKRYCNGVPATGVFHSVYHNYRTDLVLCNYRTAAGVISKRLKSNSVKPVDDQDIQILNL